MSAGVQERLQLSRVPLDTWSKREQLILASAVSCSGDQNWITVSRTLKSICGNGNGNGGGQNNRPADWFSQKNCAVQYGNLLESVEATKRKKRSSESSAGVSSPATVETPTELLLRRLTEERQAEIKAQMRHDQETYRRIQREIDSLQSDAVTEQELQDMWLEIEKEQETRRIEEMKLENRMREREQRKKEMAGNWRNSSPAARRSNQAADTTSVDMDVEDINSSGSNNGKQQTAPSPLLTSLLKSPTGNAPATPITGGGGGGAAAAGTGSVARATAPTITSLLTSGGSSAVSNQPAITMKSPTDAAFMSRPISGPPANEALTPTTPTLERSPSQAAPTLSMLLEKNKAAAAAAAKANEGGSLIKPETSGGQEPAQVEETTLTTAGTADSDETDDQLLEVFPNIDEIIDDIDIDMASVIDDEMLKDVDEVVASPSNDKGEVIDFEDKLDALKREQSKSSPASDKPKSVELVIGSSDDSNDNIPLATVASQESKDRGQSGGESSRGTEDAESEPLASEVAVEEIGETITIISTSSEDTAGSPPAKIDEEGASDSLSKKEETKEDKCDQESNFQSKKEAGEVTEGTETAENQAAGEAHSKEATEKPLPIEEKVATPSTPASNPVPGSLHDTDEESSSLTDSSKHDEQPRSAKAKPPTSKLALDDAKSELESSGTPQPPSAPARTPLLRKLPHRDRSESPMVDDDATTASDHSTARSTRRRCSSTPVIDSIPNSPASSEHTDDRRETRAASKKLFLSIYATLQDSKHAAPFKRAFHDEHAQRHADLCLRPMDLPTIKRNIDSGFIRSLSELHRDVLLMAHNVLVAYKPHTNQHKTARLFVQDCQAIKEFSQMPDTQVAGITATPVSNTGSSRAEKSSGSKARSGSRKSQRHH
ncbi:bromodomain-containing protein 8 [Drosophila takahashii]|uniref:bromodomain-containing protein 8 n=1 Tax=Drosophila takahashii TaxID=29030 RepID=UPI001CF8C333|nr:bromodomain-containing protein 8 [Drosophila takahashii]